MRAVLRPLLLLLISLTVLLAIVTTTGRVLVLFLPQLESQINTLLLHRGIEVTGLRGRWHLLNPVIAVDHVRFAGGHVGGMTLEVDVLESALHSTLIARHLSAEVVELTPVRDVDGHWGLGTSERGRRRRVRRDGSVALQRWPAVSAGANPLCRRLARQGYVVGRGSRERRAR